MGNALTHALLQYGSYSDQVVTTTRLNCFGGQKMSFSTQRVPLPPGKVPVVENSYLRAFQNFQTFKVLLKCVCSRCVDI